MVQRFIMTKPSSSELDAVLSVLKSVRPPAPQHFLDRILEVDLDKTFAQQPELLMDLVLRLTADAICASRNLMGNKQAQYRHSLEQLSSRINLITQGAPSRSEMEIYLSKLDLRVAEI